jgi:arabinan endo-1,5-alpha-L-arabinosidase
MRTLYAALFLAMLLGPSSQESGAANGAPPCPGSGGRGVPAGSLGGKEPHLILNENFPDPFIAKFGDSYHAYATGTKIGDDQLNVQLVRSGDLTRWGEPREVLPADNLPAWVDRGHPQVWAPEVMAIGGRYVLYFNARHHSLTRTEALERGPTILKRHCLGAAVADRPEGPFVGIDEPLVCAEFGEGVIDASPFRDGESLYLYYKDDGNCCGRGTAIYVQGLSADGLAAVGPRHKLFENADSPEAFDDWEWRVVEAPTMVRRGSAYYLFYSGNFYGNAYYSVGYLRCETPRGPCVDRGHNPILRSHPGTPLLGPGHQSLLDEDGESYIFFHGWNENPDGKERPGHHKRCLYVGRVQWGPSPYPREERPRVVGGAPISGS